LFVGLISALAMKINNRSNEAVSLAGYSLYEPGLLGIILQHLPNFADGAVDAVIGVEENSVAPDSLDDLFARDQLTALLDQEEQDFHRDAFQPEPSIGAAQFVGAQVELEVVAESDPIFGSDWGSDWGSD
jgi:hypothetical protein